MGPGGFSEGFWRDFFHLPRRKPDPALRDEFACAVVGVMLEAAWKDGRRGEEAMEVAAANAYRMTKFLAKARGNEPS